METKTTLGSISFKDNIASYEVDPKRLHDMADDFIRQIGSIEEEMLFNRILQCANISYLVYKLHNYKCDTLTFFYQKAYPYSFAQWEEWKFKDQCPVQSIFLFNQIIFYQ